MRKATVFVLTLVMATAAAAALADDKAEAKRHFEAGLALFKAEKYEDALVELEYSARLYPSRGGLFNLANVYKVLSRYDEALATMDRLERENEGKLAPSMAEALVQMRREIEVLVAYLEVTVEPEGALVIIDGREVGEAPLDGPVLVDPGRRVVRATRGGYRPAHAEALLVSGQREKLSLKLEPDPAAGVPHAAPAASHPTPASPHPGPLPPAGEGAGNRADEGAPISSIPSTSSIESAPSPGLHQAWFWSGLGLTAVLGGVTIGMNAAVGEARDEVTDAASRDDAIALRNGGVALLSLTGAAAITTAVLAFFTDWGEGPHPNPPASAKASAGRPPGGEGAGTGETSEGSIPSISSIPSTPQPPAPTFFATDTAAGIGVTGRF